jgi:hypothetical protein
MSLLSSPSPRRLKVGLAVFGAFAIGGVAGGAIGHHLHPPIAMAPMHPVAIRDLASSQGIVAVKGRVAESFGNRIVIDDGTGRTLVDTGPQGEDGSIAPPGAAITVQGRYDRGSFHPAYLVDASGTVTPLGPPPGFRHGPHGGPGGPDGPGGPGEEEGPGPKAPPPPPAPAAVPPAPAQNPAG